MKSQNYNNSNTVVTGGPVLEFILFRTSVEEKDSKNLKKAKSSGPDNMPAKLLEKMAMRSQTVCFDVSKSTPTPALNGVLQG
ncbi:hypothetical protein SprV_0401480100 [Sparganum proliferum]